MSTYVSVPEMLPRLRTPSTKSINPMVWMLQINGITMDIRQRQRGCRNWPMRRA
jgi:hypothetical protein